MDLQKIGKLLYDLRKSKGMTQKQVADLLGIVPETVSKWETGHGFPDVSVLSELAGILGVSENTLLSGSLARNKVEVGNMKKTKFYVCKDCGSVMYGSGECKVMCCGKTVEALSAKPDDGEHTTKISQIENDFYIEINHKMTKEHYISFVAYVSFDRVLLVRLYPEQDSSVRIPRMAKGKLFYYCNTHGLFECR